MEPNQTSKLYEACVGYLVSERTDTDAWADVCRYVQTMAVMGGDFVGHLRREFRAIEQQIKVDYEITALPAAWRSAKSTALKAVKYGHPLVADDGVPIPKSVVTEGMKAPPVPKNIDSHAFVQHMAKAQAMAALFQHECITAGPIDRTAWDRMDEAVGRVSSAVAMIPFTP